MTVRELKENLDLYDEDQEIEITFSGEIEVEAWKENKYGDKTVEVDLKLEPFFIGGSSTFWIDLKEVEK